MANSMRVYLSKYDKNKQVKTIGQKVYFINVLNGTAADLDASQQEVVAPPQKKSYPSNPAQAPEIVCLINYQKYYDEQTGRRYLEEQGFSPITKSNNDSYSAIFKQEIRDTGRVDEKGASVYEELTPLIPVDTQITNFKFRDFNVSNNRTYRYILYPYEQAPKQSIYNLQKSVKEPIGVNWQGWSITELHPVDGSNKKFTASPDDVWVFNLNVDTGEQTQNISRQEQQTLGQFNRYSQGRLNYVSGSVNCLLGSDVLPASYVIKNGKTVNEGGYQEIRKTNKAPTSNERVDMLLAWRRLVMSSNPKLLKDRAGQSFLVTINSSTNKPMDAVYRQPNTISFTWTQIGTTDGLQIVGVYE